MSSQLTYLSTYSLAVHEMTLIEKYGRLHRQREQQQAIKVGLICGGFVVLAVIALALPLFLQDFIRQMLLGFIG